MFSDTFGDSFFDGPAMQAAKAPLIGGGVAQLGMILTRKFLPSQAKHAGAIGTLLGAAAAYLLKNKLGPDGMGAAIAAAAIVGLPVELNALLGGTLLGADEVSEAELAAITANMGDIGAETPVQVMDSGSGSMGLIGAITPEVGAAPDGLSIQGATLSAY